MSAPDERSTCKKTKSKTSSLMRKLKIKKRSSSSVVATSASSPSVSSEEAAARLSPEGESNLTDAWRSAENLPTDDEGVSKVSVNVEIVRIEPQAGDDNVDGDKDNAEDVRALIKQDALVERTRSLEDLQTSSMPAFGDLVIDHRDHRVANNSTTKATKDHLYKILVIGDLGCGKTSIIKRYVHDFFSQHYRATIGVDFALKVLHWDAHTVIRLQLWDIAGQERYGNMTRVYYKEAVGAFIVFDVTRATTFESVTNWKADLDSKVQLPDGSSIPCVLLGNKCDQQKEGIVNNANKMNEFCAEKGFSGWFETSAKENINIEKATSTLISQILANDSINGNQNNKDKDQFTLNQKKDDANNSKCFKC